MEKTKTQFDELIGNKILGIFRNDDRTALSFDTDGGRIGYYADGDCCSSSWFEHFSGIETLIGHTISEIIEHEDVTLADDDPLKGKETDVEAKYGWTFTTQRGRADLDMRNDSNGYYGGSVERTGDGSPSWRKVEDSATIEIKEDF